MLRFQNRFPLVNMHSLFSLILLPAWTEGRWIPNQNRRLGSKVQLLGISGGWAFCFLVLEKQSHPRMHLDKNFARRKNERKEGTD
jgi:hypothetical protein